MKTLNQIMDDFREWQEADPENRSVSIVVVRNEGLDEDGEPVRIISGALAGDIVTLSAAHFNKMRHEPEFRRIILAAMMGYVEHEEKNAPEGDENDNNDDTDNNDSVAD